jgi:ABC-2 type transport system permease protein
VNYRLWAVAKKELLQLRRDRLTLMMMAGLPVMQLLLFGYAINTDVRHIPTVVYDQDWSAESRDLTRSLEATGFYDMVGEVRGYDEIERAIRKGVARVAVVVPPSYAEDLARGRTASVQLVVDGSDPQTVASATNTAVSLVGARASQALVARLVRLGAGALATTPIAMEPLTWYNPDLRTAIYIVPGLVGVILTMTMVMLTAMAIARERERGTLEQLVVSPVRRYELVIGKILPYVIIGYVQMTLILLIGRFVFGVPLVGSTWLLYALSFVFIAANLALGLFFSTLAKTQQQAMQMSFFFLLPNILLSGFHVPVGGDARAGALAVADPAAHALSPDRPRHHAEGQRLRGRARRARLALGAAARARDVVVAPVHEEGGLMARPRSDIADRIVRAATTRFLEDGVDGASLRRIAEDAKTNIGMVYYYFPTKDDLFLAIVESVYAGLLCDLEAALAPDAPFETRLGRMFTRLGTMNDAEMTVVRLIMREVLVSSTRLERIVERFARGHMPLVLGALFDGLEAGVVRDDVPPGALMMAVFALGFVPQVVRRRIRTPPPGVVLPAPEDLANALASVLFDGIRSEAVRRREPETRKPPRPRTARARSRRSG